MINVKVKREAGSGGGGGEGSGKGRECGEAVVEVAAGTYTVNGSPAVIGT